MKGYQIMKKRNLIIPTIFCFLILCIVIYKFISSSDYTPANDELALRIQFDIKEDIGLLIFDYEVNGHEFSSGISNTDRSLIKRDDQIIHVWNKEELQVNSGPFELSIKFRIITEYVEPNFENTYPEELTRVLKPIVLKADYGEIYDITITGDRTNGYKVLINE